jgi:hypothetical protein
MRPRLRFSLRALFIVVTLSSAAAYWLALPTLNAQRYAAAINAGDYPAADRLCLDARRVFPGDWTRHATFQSSAHVSPLRWADVRRGERRIDVAIHYGDGDGFASCGVECTATWRGIEVGMFAP